MGDLKKRAPEGALTISQPKCLRRLRMRMIAFLAAVCEEPPTEFLASAEVRASTTPVTSRSKTSLTALNSLRERSLSVLL